MGVEQHALPSLQMSGYNASGSLPNIRMLCARCLDREL